MQKGSTTGLVWVSLNQHCCFYKTTVSNIKVRPQKPACAGLLHLCTHSKLRPAVISLLVFVQEFKVEEAAFIRMEKWPPMIYLQSPPPAPLKNKIYPFKADIF